MTHYNELLVAVVSENRDGGGGTGGRVNTGTGVVRPQRKFLSDPYAATPEAVSSPVEKGETYVK